MAKVLLFAAICWLGASVGVYASDQLSEIEKLKVEKAQLIATLAQLTGDRSAWRTSFSQCIDTLGKSEAAEATKTANTFSDELIAEIEKAHKGMTLNSKGELVKKEEK